MMDRRLALNFDLASISTNSRRLTWPTFHLFLITSHHIKRQYIVSSKAVRKTRSQEHRAMTPTHFSKFQSYSSVVPVLSYNTHFDFRPPSLQTSRSLESLCSLSQDIQQADRSSSNTSRSKILFPSTLALLFFLRFSRMPFSIPMIPSFAISVSFSSPIFAPRRARMSPPRLSIPIPLPISTLPSIHLTIEHRSSLLSTIRNPNSALSPLRRLRHPHRARAALNWTPSWTWRCYGLTERVRIPSARRVGVVRISPVLFISRATLVGVI